MKTFLRPALSVFVLLSAITGLAYPLAVTGIAGAVCPFSHYSVRKASTGSSSEARRAGNTPAARPMTTATPSARNT